MAKTFVGPTSIHDVMHPRKQVDEQIAGYAGAVVPVVPPAEEPNRLERNFGSGSEELVPIDGGGRSIRRDRILPRANRGVAIPPRLDHIDLTDRSVLQQVFCLLVNDGADALAANLQDAIVLLLRVDDLAGRPRLFWTMGFSTYTSLPAFMASTAI